MIASLLLKYGIPSWLAELVAGALLVLALWAGIAWHDHRVFSRGVAQESARRDVIEAAISAKANSERAHLNILLAAVQAELNSEKANVAKLQTELDHAQTSNTTLQSDLAAGRQRLRVALAVRAAGPAGSAEGAPAGGLDSQPGATADLDPQAASRVAELTGEGDAAIIRLNACILRYDALKQAVDAAP